MAGPHTRTETRGKVDFVGVVNSDNPLPAEQFNMPTDGFYSTGAPGSDSGNTAAAAAPELARVGVSPGNYPDSPLARPRDLAVVSLGDTFSASDDQPYGIDGREDFSGAKLDTGGSGQFQPGSGRVSTPHHPGVA